MPNKKPSRLDMLSQPQNHPLKVIYKNTRDLDSLKFRLSQPKDEGSVPSVPQAVQALRQNGGSTRIKWQPCPDPDIDHYNIYKSSSADGSNPRIIGHKSPSRNIEKRLHFDFTGRTNLYYAVEAVDEETLSSGFSVWVATQLDLETGTGGYDEATYDETYDNDFTNIVADTDSGFTIKNQGKTLGHWTATGDLRIGLDTSQVDTTKFAIFNTAQDFGYIHAQVGDAFLGNAAGKHLFYDNSGGQLVFRDGTHNNLVVDAVGKITVGEVAEGKPNVRLAAGAIRLRQWRTDKLVLDADGTITVGEVSTDHHNIFIAEDQIRLRNNETTRVLIKDTEIVVGVVSSGRKNIQITNDEINFRTNSITKLQIDTNDGILVGEIGTSKSNVLINSGEVRLRNNTTTKILLDTSGYITLGAVAASRKNIYIDNDTVLFRTNTTTKLQIDASDGITIGEVAVGLPNITLSSTALNVRRNTTNYLSIDSSGVSITNSIGFDRQDSGSVGSGDIDLDHSGATYVRISSASAAFNIKSIKEGKRDGHLLILQNDTGQTMTLYNNYYGGSPPANYNSVYTLMADVTIAGYGAAILIWTSAQSPSQWFLVSHDGGAHSGYTALTGTADRATVWDTATVTTAQLAQRVKAMEDDLLSYGTFTG